MKRFLALFAALILLLTTVSWTAAEDEILYTGTVAGGSLHLRKEPNSSAKVINTYKAGTQVDILENDGTWCKVKVGKNTGYMMTQYLTIKPNYPHLGWGKTPDDGTVLNVRAQADASSPVVYKALSGGVLEVLEETGGWMRVRAGSVFGYVEKNRLTLFDGDYIPMVSVLGQASLSLDTLRKSPRDIGSIRTITRSEGDFTYAITYPTLDVKAADDAMYAWTQGILRIFEADRQANHAASSASLTVEYQAVNLDSRYQSVLLMGEYAVDGFRVTAFLPVNVDRETGALLNGETDLFVRDLTWPLFCLEGAASSFLSAPTDGYSGKPDASWLRYAVLGRDGVELYLPAGLYLPAAYGSQKLVLKYPQMTEYMALSSDYIAGFKRKIDPTKPMLALTFDDGPSEVTDRILRVLAEYNGRATFCVIGNKVDAYPDVIKRTIAGGNEIACHTWSHPKLINLSYANIKSQIERTNAAVRVITGGYEIKVLRPPYGSVNKNVRSVCAELDMVIAHWELDTKDWSTRSTSKTYRAIMKGAANGLIVLCHDLYETTAAAAEQAIPELVAQGYQLVTVSELLSFHKNGATPGTVYSHLDPKNIRTD